MLAKCFRCSCTGKSKGERKRKERNAQASVPMNAIIQHQPPDQARTKMGQPSHSFPALPPTPRPDSGKVSSIRFRLNILQSKTHGDVVLIRAIYLMFDSKTLSCCHDSVSLQY